MMPWSIGVFRYKLIHKMAAFQSASSIFQLMLWYHTLTIFFARMFCSACRYGASNYYPPTITHSSTWRMNYKLHIICGHSSSLWNYIEHHDGQYGVCIKGSIYIFLKRLGLMILCFPAHTKTYVFFFKKNTKISEKLHSFPEEIAVPNTNTILLTQTH